MIDSPRRSHRPQVQRQNEVEEEDREEQNGASPQQRLCDYCGESRALLYCRADSAKLCFSCDRQVHLANPLFIKHTRSLLCDACDSNLASIFCSTQNLVFCQNCDWDTHGLSLASLHDRRPIEGFSGCPSAIELSTILGFDNLGLKSPFLAEKHGDDCLLSSDSSGSMDGFLDPFVWDTPPILSFDDLIASTDSNHNFQALGIPPLPKNRNAACGKQKKEIMRQLRELLKLEPVLNDDHGNFDLPLGSQPLVREQDLQMKNFGSGFENNAESIVLPSYEACALRWQRDIDEAADQVSLSFTVPENYVEESLLALDKHTDSGSSRSHGNGGHEEQPEHPPVNGNSPVMPKVYPQELASRDRDSVISRYKEKKKTRRYDRHIRYESRKARAESRIRIKGRFAKVNT